VLLKILGCCSIANGLLAFQSDGQSRALPLYHNTSAFNKLNHWPSANLHSSTEVVQFTPLFTSIGDLWGRQVSGSVQLEVLRVSAKVSLIMELAFG